MEVEDRLEVVSNLEHHGEEGRGEVIASLENVHKTYLMGTSAVAAVRGVSMEVRRGDLVTLYGPSGCGKSTLLSMLGTVDIASRGEVRLFGERVKNHRGLEDELLARIRLRKVGFVFQAFNLLESLTVVENVELPMLIAMGGPNGDRFGRHGIRNRAEELLNQLGMAGKANAKPAMLSGGEQQRVTIARALANEPDLIICDEPTGDLDEENSNRVMEILLNLHIAGRVTIVMATHDTNLSCYATRVIHMRDGRILQVRENEAGDRQRAIDMLRERNRTTREQSRSQESCTVLRDPDYYRARMLARMAVDDSDATR
mmetsp:Transcript_9631/g.19670  ORF Transcript_9631/g.19670 Transcript_9631/m.19670 type:complete len:315 (-) Transcript_9631:135-1079(-)